MERAPRRDGPPSALTVPQFVCAMDGQALQVVPAATATSSGSRGPRCSLALGQLRFCEHREEKVNQDGGNTEKEPQLWRPAHLKWALNQTGAVFTSHSKSGL